MYIQFELMDVSFFSFIIKEAKFKNNFEFYLLPHFSR